MTTKRMMATLTVIAMIIVAISGCQTTPAATTPAATTTTATTTTATTTTAATTTAATTIAPEGTSSTGGEVPTTLDVPEKLPLTTDKVTITALVNLLPWVADIVNNDYTKELEQKTNVHLEMTVVPDDSYQDKLNLLLSSGEYPEVIMSGGFDNAALVKYGSQEKILIPLNDLIDKYSVYLKERLAERPYFQQEMTAPDGNIYGLPSFSDQVGHVAMQYKLWINQAWIDKLGLKMPTTTEEFKNVLMAFKSKDPNGNGKADEIPLSGAIDLGNGDPYWFIMNAFTYFDSKLLKLKDGKFSFTADTDGFREGISYLADLYSAGLIDPAAFTQNLDQLLKLGNNPNEIILGSFAGLHPGIALDLNNIERSKQYTALLPLKGPSGYQSVPYTTQVNVNGASWVITDKCKNPDIAFRLADLLYSEDEFMRYEHGTKGIQWTDADPGTFGIDGKTPAKFKLLQDQSSMQENTWRWCGTSIWASPKDWKNLWQAGDDLYDPLNYEKRLLVETLKFAPYAADADQITPLFVDADTASRISQLFTPINDYVFSSMIEFITGKKSVDADWDTYIDGLNKLSYLDFVQAEQAAYDSMKK